MEFRVHHKLRMNNSVQRHEFKCHKPSNSPSIYDKRYQQKINESTVTKVTDCNMERISCST